jgi:hypothetical protein
MKKYRLTCTTFCPRYPPTPTPMSRFSRNASYRSTKSLNRTQRWTDQFRARGRLSSAQGTLQRWDCASRPWANRTETRCRVVFNGIVLIQEQCGNIINQFVGQRISLRSVDSSENSSDLGCRRDSLPLVGTATSCVRNQRRQRIHDAFPRLGLNTPR